MASHATPASRIITYTAGRGHSRWSLWVRVPLLPTSFAAKTTLNVQLSSWRAGCAPRITQTRFSPSECVRTRNRGAGQRSQKSSIRRAKHPTSTWPWTPGTSACFPCAQSAASPSSSLRQTPNGMTLTSTPSTMTTRTLILQISRSSLHPPQSLYLPPRPAWRAWETVTVANT